MSGVEFEEDEDEEEEELDVEEFDEIVDVAKE